MLVALGPLFATLGALKLWRVRADREGRRSPLTKDLLRGPGESLREELAELEWDLATYFGLVPLPFFFAYGFLLSGRVIDDRSPGTTQTVILVGAAAIALGWLWWKIWKTMSARRRLTLGLEAELAVGQELAQLGVEGFHVFHDLPARGFNIDHIVVGDAGIFAVETKGRSKLGRTSGGEPGWRAQFDGVYVKFPGGRDSKPVDQTVRQAKWLEDWLTSAVGEPVMVQPLLVLPGWFVERTGQGIPVIGSGEIRGYFGKRGSRSPLSEQLVRRIVHQLDQRCRNVEPRAYGARTRAKD